MGSSPRVWGQGEGNAKHIDHDGIIPTRMGTSFKLGFSDCLLRDHPHAYGDKYASSHGDPENWGSSPRVWGQVFIRSDFNHPLRIIPTRMGTSGCQNTVKTWTGDHPHAYGDKYSNPSAKHTITGSSPRVWGQAPLSKRYPTSAMDHPHAYGDKSYLSR